MLPPPITNYFTERIMVLDFPLSFFCQGIDLADPDRVCPIAELCAHGLAFNHACTYRETRDERQKHP